MGLFDGGGFDMDALMNMINPMGTAEAANALGPNGAPQTGLTPDALAASVANTPPLSSLPAITPPPPPPAAPPPAPTDGLGTDAPPPNPIVSLDRGLATPAAAGGGAAPVLAKPSLDQIATDNAVGAALTGGAAEPAPGGNTDVGARAKSPDDAKNPSLATALRGVKMPAAPAVQKISSPSAPRPTGQIKGGELIALLNALNSGAPSMARQLPVTLGKG